MSIRLEAIIRGRVQFVMYRDFAERKARGLRLVGEVQNMPDGTVRLVAEGTKEVLETYITKLRKGPLLARVDAVDVSFGEAEGTFSKFSIRYE